MDDLKNRLLVLYYVQDELPEPGKPVPLPTPIPLLVAQYLADKRSLMATQRIFTRFSDNIHSCKSCLVQQTTLFLGWTRGTCVPK